jgi:hypothetical protein
MTVDDNQPGTKPPAVPHPYIPPGPVDAAPYAGFCQPETRQAASLMWRCRRAGAAQLAARLDGLRRLLDAVLADEHRSRQLALEHAAAELTDIGTAGPVPADGFTVSAADAGVIRQALTDASAWRTEGDRAADVRLATAYEVLLRRLVTEQEAH